ncbi:MAG: Si-specific NAD(P)(+) transhydrogenase [Planctomycetota bacterium]|nr:Si-specific NAD(P)(+) transhydrogenase [Planctomycetota bacterium]
MMRYDVLIIGSGPAGQKGAIAAAKAGKRVALVEREQRQFGGVCLHTGTIPSKTMREAILYLTGFRHREVYRENYGRRRQITMDDLRRKLSQVTEVEVRVVHDQLERNDIDLYTGEGRFIGPHHYELGDGSQRQVLEASTVLIATGTRPARPSHIPFDGQTIFDSDELLALEKIPRSMIVIGGGVIGIEYAIMLAILGVRVTVVDGRERLLEFCDDEIVDMLLFQARALKMMFRLGEHVTEMRRCDSGAVMVELESGKKLLADTALYSVGRQGESASLNLAAAGLEADPRGRIRVDENFQTTVPHIYGVGDIVGFPALASVSMEQGRRAVSHALGRSFKSSDHMHYGLFTIPEIAMVGQTERQLTEQRVPYETGVARFDEIARGQICGDDFGMLKLLFHRETRHLLGVHCIGESATELVHVGQAVMALNGTMDYFRDTVFNHPTMSESYKVAAMNGLNKLQLGELPREKAETQFIPDLTHDLPMGGVVSAIAT